jgi:hypothetical protein
VLGDDGERAPKAVTAHIREAIARIERAHPALGHHHRAASAYAPAEAIRWRR